MSNMSAPLMLVNVALASLTLCFSSCSAPPIRMTADDIKLSRLPAKDNCTFLGSIEGRALTVKGGEDEAFEDLKNSAAKKGANYLVIEETSGTGAAVRAQAYLCP